MTNDELKYRTKQFSLMVLSLVEKLPNSISSRVVVNQLAKSATSVGTNYRAVCRARSDKEFIAKLNIVLEEADETQYWLEIIEEMKWINKSELEFLLKESSELVAIFVSTLKTVNNRLNSK
ncbi:four helix bundle protein [Flavobacterium sp. 25HG05S-40]|uniref:four helix bundle protein n=1 Tax=Flavobacterium sp. 25HG05S-40 TaxID=3458682 RepID=UPI004044C611